MEQECFTFIYLGVEKSSNTEGVTVTAEREEEQIFWAWPPTVFMLAVKTSERVTSPFLQRRGVDEGNPLEKKRFL